MKRRTNTVFLGFLIMASSAAQAVDAPCRETSGGRGEARAVVSAADTLLKLLTAPQRAAFSRPFDHESAIRWSNLPVGVVPRLGLRLGDLDATQSAAAHRLAEAALSACGLKMFDEIRLADDFLTAADTRKIGWAAANYYMSVLGAPSERTPWMLQIGGHHIAYNFTFNGGLDGATPLFFGSEPIRFTVKGVEYEPLTAQSTAMSNLARALSAHGEAKLSGTFTDVVKGVEVTMVPGQMPTGGTDSGFPHTYPTGKADRGILYSALAPGQQALVREALESYASLPGQSITRSLVASYEEPAALAETYVGYSGSPDLSEKGSYVRIDGPRIWMEFVVQPAVADRTTLHYHALWRDKQSDYGGQVRR
jgi:hypothetical protein